MATMRQPGFPEPEYRGSAEFSLLRRSFATANSGFVRRSDPELPEMMVEMFVDQNRPLPRRHLPKETMGILRNAAAPPATNLSIKCDKRSRSLAESRSSATIRLFAVGEFLRTGS
jgi:hypothetical protein